MRLWVEIHCQPDNIQLFHCQPPCEAVSWNASGRHKTEHLSSQPPCEAVSWNIVSERKVSSYVSVSLLVRLWVEILTLSDMVVNVTVSLLVRLWVEIPRLSRNFWTDSVSLLVRLWVEIVSPLLLPAAEFTSASLWGCELKCVCIHAYRDTLPVSLLVRLWVEIVLTSAHIGSRPSASLWGCELKYTDELSRTEPFCQPPCEAVSWNKATNEDFRPPRVSLLVRLWVEIRTVPDTGSEVPCQPPCEAVSWNTLSLLLTLHTPPSASLWGCELK